MFLAILSWMLAHVPTFMRPAVNWLVDGLRKITGAIASLWNTLGISAGVLFTAVARWRATMATFVTAVANGFWWIRNVYIPARLNALLLTTVGLINAAVALAHNTAMAALLGVQQWTGSLIAGLSTFVTGVRDWALHQLARLDTLLTTLVSAVRHVTSGPAVLAEWLIGELFNSALRRLYTERDRVFDWLFARSAAFTVWIGRQLEDMIVRLL